MLELRRISKEAIPSALALAERYRLLNEPHEAESICRDILQTEPGNQDAVIALVLALTDQFGTRHGADMNKAREVLAQLIDEYDFAYYGGIIYERWAKAQFEAHAPNELALNWVEEAMTLYQRAEALRPDGNDNPVLRWNSCLRFIEKMQLMVETEGTLPETGSGDKPQSTQRKP